MVGKQASLLSVIGARPHYMKVAPIHWAATGRGLQHQILHTGQHYDSELASNYEKEFHLPKPILNLNIGSNRQAIQIAHVIEGVDNSIAQVEPDFILVYGDTNSTAGAAIAAAKNNVPLVHVEAGLREFRKDVPEEVNKLLIDSISDIFCCPTQSAVEQLKKENKEKGVIFSGDVVLDVIKKQGNKIKSIDTTLTQKLKNKPFYFVTIHREANTSDRLKLGQLVDALLALPHQVVFAVHPRTKAALVQYDLWQKLLIDRIYTLTSRPFWETQWLIANALLTLTDSGGISKESYFHKTGCILLDEQIEWVELVESGWLKIAGTDTKGILNAVQSFEKPMTHLNVFGNGNAAELIIDEILKYHASRK